MSVRMVADGAALENLILTAARSPDLDVQQAVALLVRTGTSPAAPPKPWLSVAEAAARWDVHEKTVRRAVNRGEWSHRRIGRRLLVAASGPDGTTADTAHAPPVPAPDNGANDQEKAA